MPGNYIKMLFSSNLFSLSFYLDCWETLQRKSWHEYKEQNRPHPFTHYAGEGQGRLCNGAVVLGSRSKHWRWRRKHTLAQSSPCRYQHNVVLTIMVLIFSSEWWSTLASNLDIVFSASLLLCLFMIITASILLNFL